MYDKITTTGNMLLTVGRIPTSRQILVLSTPPHCIGLANETRTLLVSGRRGPSLFNRIRSTYGSTMQNPSCAENYGPNATVDYG